MIDVHCHLEQEDYSQDREEVIRECKKELKAIITCCAHPKDLDLTLSLVEKYKDFVFATVGIHPEYVKEVSEEEKKSFFQKVKDNVEKIVGIGETGLDFFWVKEKEWQEKQKELFIEFIELAKDLDLPIIIHSREAYDEAVEILEQENTKKVLLHMFGANHLVKRIVDNGWFVSTNTILLKSKKHKKVVRDVPLERIMLETDSPWLSPSGKRNTPLSVKIVAEKIAEIKKVSFEDVKKITTENALKFFNILSE
ncbi:MAG: TatD family hydrolase [Candidatus Aenigmarchaeota archaeon]|nr:TatD family hydrolase [Candidatus Aenigmarchaeota archaeon]